MRWTSREGLQLFPGHPKGIFASQRLPAVHPVVPFDTALTTSPKRPCRPCKDERIVMFNQCHNCMPCMAIVHLSPYFSTCLHASHDPYNVARQDDTTILRQRQILSKLPLAKFFVWYENFSNLDWLRSSLSRVGRARQGHVAPFLINEEYVNMFSLACSQCLITVRKVFGISRTDFLATKH